MKNSDFLVRHGIVRNAIKQDILCFALPATIIFTAGLTASALDAVISLVPLLSAPIQQPSDLLPLHAQLALGLALIVIGYVFLFVGFWTVRRFYSSTLVIRENHKLITHGIYRLTRHPMYLGVILVAIGMPVCALSLYGLFIMSALLPIFLVRIRIEERLLTEEFGDDYRAYMAATRRLIPFIY